MNVDPAKSGDSFESNMSGDAQPLIGVLALQGAFAAHETMFRQLGCRTRQVRTAVDLDGLNGLVLPGGESTTMSNLLVSSDLFCAVSEKISAGLSVLGTCAGMILLASRISDGRADQVCFSAIDMEVRRNAYGRQIDSFETQLEVRGVDHRVPALFIRAPIVENVGPNVEVLAHEDGRPCLVRQDRVWAASFHPELTADSSVHSLFVDCVESSANDKAQSTNSSRSTVGAAQEQE